MKAAIAGVQSWFLKCLGKETKMHEKYGQSKKLPDGVFLAQVFHRRLNIISDGLKTFTM